ncbi:MAG: hypothetical protein OEW56_11475 [Gemmatimonadota bacterium]|nr:hypothetical protein [Gemmatimonadota bacterium]
MRETPTTVARRATRLAPIVVAFLGFLPVLTVLPYWFPVDPDIASAANAAGYNANAAFLLSFVWSAVVIVVVAVVQGGGYFGPDPIPQVSPPTLKAPWRTRGFWLGFGGVVLCVLLVYNPPFLSWRGPYIEDSFFLSNLHRMAAGQRPFLDFEFLYSPAMIYLPDAWNRLFGFSLVSYYSYLVLLEILAYTILLAVIFPSIRDWRPRLFAFALVAALILNVLLGPNQNGLRKLMPVVALLAAASSPTSARHVVGAAAILGFQFAYSHEYGIAAAAALAGMYGYLALVQRRLRPALMGLALLGGSLVVWAALSLLMLGPAFDDYIVQTLYLLDRFRRGQSSFEFYFTANSLAAFLLLSMALVVTGRGLVRGFVTRDVTWTDLFFLGAVLYAMVALKSGLNRSDLWHLVPPFIPLVLAFLLPWTTRAFAVSQRALLWAKGAIVLLAVTYTIGQAPMGSLLAESLLVGAQARLQGRDASLPTPLTTPGPVLRLHGPNPDLKSAAIVERLQQLAPAGAPVLYYSDTWALDKMIGYPKTYFSNDDFLHSEERGIELRVMLEEQPETVVLMRRPVYERLYGLADSTRFDDHLVKYRPTLTKRVSAVLSTVHYRGLAAEAAVKEARWTRTVGNYVREHYAIDSEFQGNVILVRKRGAP